MLAVTRYVSCNPLFCHFKISQHFFYQKILSEDLNFFKCLSDFGEETINCFQTNDNVFVRDWGSVCENPTL